MVPWLRVWLALSPMANRTGRSVLVAAVLLELVSAWQAVAADRVDLQEVGELGRVQFDPRQEDGLSRGLASAAEYQAQLVWYCSELGEFPADREYSPRSCVGCRARLGRAGRTWRRSRCRSDCCR